jgi:hypothetical protein
MLANHINGKCQITLEKRLFKLFTCYLALMFMLPPALGDSTSNHIEKGEMNGYLLVPNNRVPETYNAGFSMYAAAWPLLQEYPGRRFQTGLFGTWMHAQYDGPEPDNLYSDIEGGLGWWRDTRFATETPKFIMGGVALNFSAWANGPGAGNHCWTLFLNTQNFKGPVAFFTPYFWSRASVENPRLAGMFLDTRCSGPNRALQMETQYVPSVQATDNKGRIYARIAPTSFPQGPKGDSVVVHRVTAYNKKALWDAVKVWFEGGPPASGVINPQGSVVHSFPGEGGATWKIHTPLIPGEEEGPIAWDSFATPVAPDSSTFGYKWNYQLVTRKESKDGPLVTLPQYYHLVKDNNEKAKWIPVQPEDVPTETGLAEVRFSRPIERASKPYVTPDDEESCWKKPGPVAGPFRVHPGDGSVVTYYWYRFADQPALLNADLTDKERENMQGRVEKLHRNWKKDRDYLAPPSIGKLAHIDPALIVNPPPGLEAGYVPIATRQEEEITAVKSDP